MLTRLDMEALISNNFMSNFHLIPYHRTDRMKTHGCLVNITDTIYHWRLIKVDINPRKAINCNYVSIIYIGEKPSGEFL